MYRLAVSILDDGAAVAAAVRAEHVTAVSTVVLADEEGEVGVAAFAPENCFVLHPTRASVVLDCNENYYCKGSNRETQDSSARSQTRMS